MNKKKYEKQYWRMTKREWWRAMIAIVLLAWVAFTLVIRSQKRKENLKSYQNYTIGTCVDVDKFMIKSPEVTFTYTISGHSFRETNIFNKKRQNPKEGKNYLVMYSPLNPENSHILLKIMIPDSIEAPGEGWENVPFGIIDSLDVEW